MQDHPETLASLILRLRSEKWPSRREADRATGIPYATWQNVELRGTIPTFETMTLLAAKLGVAEDVVLSAARVSLAERAQADLAEPPPAGNSRAAKRQEPRATRRGTRSKRPPEL